MSDLAQRRLREWRSGAIRELLELENLAKSLRDQLEDGSLRIDQMEDHASDVNSHVMTLITYVDRASGLAEVGFW